MASWRLRQTWQTCSIGSRAKEGILGSGLRFEKGPSVRRACKCSVCIADGAASSAESTIIAGRFRVSLASAPPRAQRSERADVRQGSSYLSFLRPSLRRGWRLNYPMVESWRFNVLAFPGLTLPSAGNLDCSEPLL